jgi:hypothetical protein
VNELWTEIEVGLDHSMYRDFVGITQISATDEDYEVGYDNEIFSPKSNKVQPGTYRVVSRTHSLGNNDLLKSCRMV